MDSQEHVSPSEKREPCRCRVGSIHETTIKGNSPTLGFENELRSQPWSVDLEGIRAGLPRAAAASQADSLPGRARIWFLPPPSPLFG